MYLIILLKYLTLHVDNSKHPNDLTRADLTGADLTGNRGPI
jgi:hypothetical protein